MDDMGMFTVVTVRCVLNPEPALACGGAATVATPSPSATPTSTPSPTATAAASAAAWTVSDKSKATVRVREQLVGVNLPSDAVLTATGAKGSFELAPDGT